MLLNFYDQVSPFSGFITATAILSWHFNKVITYSIKESLEKGCNTPSAASIERGQNYF